MISHAWAALLMGFAAQAAVAQERAALPYDAEKDFAPVNLTVAAPLVLVVHPSTPAKSVNDLVKLAKARPGQLAFPCGPASHL